MKAYVFAFLNNFVFALYIFVLLQIGILAYWPMFLLLNFQYIKTIVCYLHDASGHNNVRHDKNKKIFCLYLISFLNAGIAQVAEILPHGQLRLLIHGQCMMTSSNGNISALLVLCAGNSPVIGEFPAQRPVSRSFDVFFHLRLNKRLSKQSLGWWFETPSHPLWRHCNDMILLQVSW